MGKAAANTGDGGENSRDGGARRESAICGRRRAARPATEHTVAGRRIRAGRPFAVTSPLSASRVDEKFSASTEQVRERCARVGGGAAWRGGGERRGRGLGRGLGRGRGRRQEGRAAAEGDALVGPHGRARAGRAGAGADAAAVRDGAAPRAAHAAARRVTPRGRTAAARLYHITLTFHYRDDQTRRGARASRSIIDLVFIYWGPFAGPRAGRASDTCRTPRPEPEPKPAGSVASLNTLIGLDVEIIVSIEKLCS